jgi:hypothetical protein
MNRDISPLVRLRWTVAGNPVPSQLLHFMNCDVSLLVRLRWTVAGNPVPSQLPHFVTSLHWCDSVGPLLAIQ